MLVRDNWRTIWMDWERICPPLFAAACQASWIQGSGWWRGGATTIRVHAQVHYSVGDVDD